MATAPTKTTKPTKASALTAALDKKVKANSYTNAKPGALSGIGLPSAAATRALTAGRRPSVVKDANGGAKKTGVAGVNDATGAYDGGDAVGAGTGGVAAATAFNPNGNLEWQGAKGLSAEAVGWLNQGADAEYVDDYNDATLTKNKFLTSLGKTAAQAKTDRTSALRKLGYDTATKSWNDNDLTTGRGRDLNQQGYDYSARGLLHSSEYGQAATNLNQQYTDQLDAVTLAGQRYDDNVNDQITDANDDYNSARLAAIRNAVQRRAATAGTLI